MTLTGDCFTISPEYRVADIYVAQVDTVCLDASELPGNVLSIENACIGSGEYVIFDRITGSLCFICTGIEVGTEKVCFTLCDDKGFCDTTYLTVNVLDRDSRVSAGNDVDTTIANTKVIIPVLANDTVPGLVSTLIITRQPSHGMAFRNADNTISYVPNQDYCDENHFDQFEYVVCNAVSCDTAIVRVLTLCDKIRIFTGFSPNNDAMNDFFVIEGIHNFPNNRLTMFNRWGEQLYYKEKYDNTWDGSFEGRPLPDGTYFYIFEDGEGDVYRGYVQIHR